ncbi:hypothetical protein Patl1_24085 [Pistacia atlantica]|uniref:Uncharacterized protein n=1 Tax=Pistacia atlantica TaxID=434234 RepID=A0ACC0ZZ45_9ROSI|nr:hypothetical protein Patl1_24085 [Pistacia atlantica]
MKTGPRPGAPLGKWLKELYTWKELQIWKSQRKKVPKPIIMMDWYYFQGRKAEAVKHLRLAAAYNPEYNELCNNVKMTTMILQVILAAAGEQITNLFVKCTRRCCKLICSRPPTQHIHIP